MDTRRFGPGERIVFEPYTREMYEGAQRWVMARGIFEDKNTVIRDFRASTTATTG